MNDLVANRVILLVLALGCLQFIGIFLAVTHPTWTRLGFVMRLLSLAYVLVSSVAFLVIIYNT